ncbi:hypothetical protein [Defluviitalea saccharophila]|uniref:SprT-like domain-containing protein n=1 Tax=Defluviitalea saccharophila TaxID=879970 RepID=A0ABZ2Y4J8_9FIRM
MNNLQEYVNKLALANWNREFNLPVEVVADLDAHGMFGGEFSPLGLRIPIGMKLSKDLIDHYPDYIIDGVILHELCHWFLFITGKPCGDTDIEFVEEMFRVGGLFPNQIPKIGYYPVAICKKCRKIIGTEESESKCKSRLKNYNSLCCNSPLMYGGIRYINELENCRECK